MDADAKDYKIAAKSYGSFLKQKAKCAWLKDGDAITRLFHKSTKKR